ncbi:type IV toxin-antitoxin system AbiEi family antitoxin domain-containing protein [Ornithinimicrobium cavernae]|uniref:type IV toxin-antitoxin system AbiEi family antitoxin domain-containing protein n=1 Tax=Ornithinimicrobium cavernae TaxID=2666047 RepID=UPI000D69C350|nr:hypothetical protein [Ornithinimicrobium cavernae]
MDQQTEQAVRSVAGGQCRTISRPQALAAGMSSRQIDGQLRGRRWQRIHPGVYATHTGPLDWSARVWAAVLYTGSGAALSHQTAAFIWGLEPRRPSVLSLAIPSRRTVVRQPGLRVVRRRRVEVVRHRRLPITSVRQTVLDLTAQPGFTLDETAALLGRASQRNLLDPAALLELLDAQWHHPMAGRLRRACADAVEGVESPLELRVLRGVIRGHGLAGFELQVPHDDQDPPVSGLHVAATANRDGESGHRGLGVAGGRRHVRRSDLRHRALGIRVEGDGLAWHGGDRFHEDRCRDREAAAVGDVTVRVTWDAAEDPCQVALDLACTMTHRGWTGVPTRCGTSCDVPERWAVRTRRAAG